MEARIKILDIIRRLTGDLYYKDLQPSSERKIKITLPEILMIELHDEMRKELHEAGLVIIKENKESSEFKGISHPTFGHAEIVHGEFIKIEKL